MKTDITLFIMTRKGYEALSSIIEKGLQNIISAVIIGRDKNVLKDYADDIIILCKNHNIDYYERKENYSIISKYSIAISWRWLINNNSSRLIIFHDSLLPKYRGFSPLVNMLINQEKEIGVTAIYASDEYDKGDIIAQSSREINYPIKIADAIELITKEYKKLAITIVSQLNAGMELPSEPQKEELASYSLWRNDDDYEINWNDNAKKIQRLINAVSFPYKGASSYINGTKKIRILDSEIEKDVYIENRDVGKVIFFQEKYPVIVCGKGLLKITNAVDNETEEDILPLKNFRTILTKRAFK